MFNNISWQGYWLTIALLSTGYYLTVYLLYFRNDFKVFFNRKLSVNNHSHFVSPGSDLKQETSNSQPSLFDDAIEFQSPDPHSEEAIVYACIDEIDAFLKEAKKSKCIKEELIFSLQLILKKYPSLKNSQFKASVTNVIVGQCEHNCSIHLNADDVVRVWFGQ